MSKAKDLTTLVFFAARDSGLAHDAVAGVLLALGACEALEGGLSKKQVLRLVETAWDENESKKAEQGQEH